MEPISSVARSTKNRLTNKISSCSRKVLEAETKFQKLGACRRIKSIEDDDQALTKSENSSEMCQMQIFDTEKTEARRQWVFGKVLDPRSKPIKKWNRLFLLSRALSLAIDPLFLYLLAIDQKSSCLYVDGGFAILVTILRTVIDLMMLWHIWLQLKLAFVSKKSLVIGRGKLVWDGKKVAMHYLHQKEGFLFDVLVILPIMEVMIWMIIPQTIVSEGQNSIMVTIFLIIFIIQYVPKVFHLVLLIRRMQHVTGYVFGTAWWGFVLNLTAYLIASHVAGACWYTLGLQRVETCLNMECQTINCNSKILGCPKPIFFKEHTFHHVPLSSSIGKGTQPFQVCIQNTNTTAFNYGIYQSTLTLVTTIRWLERISYPIFWGLMTLSSFGNLSPTNHVPEVAFSIFVITCGLLLFTLLIGNIQMFLYSMTSKKEQMHLKMRDVEHWMRRRQLPSRLRHRVRQYERHKWAATRGVNEDAMVQNLPEGLKRDIKRHLCLDLVRQVPLFDQMDEVVLDSICDRVKPLLLIKDEVIMREGDPVLKMLFIVRGHLQSVYRVSHNATSTVVVGPGNFCGDELLSWCLRKPFDNKLPSSIATLTCLESVEAFGLDAQDLKYVTEHFRYTFSNEKLKHTARYYSPGWRTWAAVTIQLAWRRYKMCKCNGDVSISKIGPLASETLRKPGQMRTQMDLLRMYTAMFGSSKPKDHQFI